jgi:hypothetical protein
MFRGISAGWNPSRALAAAARCLAKLPRHHSTEQTLYFNDDGLLARHDYDVQISGGTTAAHYVSDYDVAGIKLPIKNRIFPRTLAGQSLADPLVVSIDVSEIAFT